MQKEHGLRSTSPPHTSSSPYLGRSQSQGQNKAGGISGHHAAQENRRQHWATCVSLSKKYIHVELLLVLQWGGRQSGSVRKGRILHSTSFLPPLEKQRVGCIFYLLYLDLLIVNTHRGQGTGHLLLGAGKEERREAQAVRDRQTRQEKGTVNTCQLWVHTADSSILQHWVKHGLATV